MTKDTEDHKQEQEMRDAKVPTLETAEELTAYIDGLVKRQHDYGTCVYAMSMAATAAFNYVAHKLGVTGFQASCADMDILRRTRSIEGPFMILDGEKALYPQYDLEGKVREWLEGDDFKAWISEQAKKKLADANGASPSVVAHWRRFVQ
jgi:hypothetical protein